MALFKNAYYSHEHSLRVLTILREYDTFLESLKRVADMGCGGGLDSVWWANMSTRDDPPDPLNYTVYAVDTDIKQLETTASTHKNIIPIEGNFEERVLPTQVDLIWAHDSLQYAINPLKCLETWRKSMNINGMLVLSIPQTVYMENNRIKIIGQHHQLYNFNLLNLIYMLSITGFDCRDAYFYRENNTPWLYAAVYADRQPLDHIPSWYELAEQKLLNDSLIQSINKYGYPKLEDTLVCWLDKNNYFIKD